MPENIVRQSVISIHAPREGSDPRRRGAQTRSAYFYPRSPRGERRSAIRPAPTLPSSFLSTLPARGATAGTYGDAADAFYISIHAPREGSDISIFANAGETVTFLSTLPARGATVIAKAGLEVVRISIHAPREGSDADEAGLVRGQVISIHAPREGSDGGQHVHHVDGNISIHAPREGSDNKSGAHRSCFFAISIHAPREGSDWLQMLKENRAAEFLSTLPARGATAIIISHFSFSIYFYPRSPRGERPASGEKLADDLDISIHAPREGSDISSSRRVTSSSGISIHAPREGSDF